MIYPSQAFNTTTSGEVQGGTTAFQLPSVSCSYVNIKAATGNSGNVYLGGAGVTVPDGSTDTTSGFVLDAGQETGWLPIENLDNLYAICDNNGDDLTYMILSYTVSS